ncbi:hypothetical protein Cgig2_002669 [Carnegiea gigantea]|uniref:Uncharacterized protein n=1 Tax=Carnegiea gigantea TaxID=171969 RepID=A0A9Q1K2Z8_9CARY|nr:hypothetical protein Cgig2_002669 [Carnegiea gigantea]
MDISEPFPEQVTSMDKYGNLIMQQLDFKWRPLKCTRLEQSALIEVALVYEAHDNQQKLSLYELRDWNFHIKRPRIVEGFGCFESRSEMQNNAGFYGPKEWDELKEWGGLNPLQGARGWASGFGEPRARFFKHRSSRGKKKKYFSCRSIRIFPSITGLGFDTLHLIKQAREKSNYKNVGENPP